jgi:hypothetical protein
MMPTKKRRRGKKLLYGSNGGLAGANSSISSLFRRRLSSCIEYVFGVEGAWVLTPSRHGAHNWEYTGHDTARSSLKALQLAFDGGLTFI